MKEKIKEGVKLVARKVYGYTNGWSFDLPMAEGLPWTLTFGSKKALLERVVSEGYKASDVVWVGVRRYVRRTQKAVLLNEVKA